MADKDKPEDKGNATMYYNGHLIYYKKNGKILLDINNPSQYDKYQTQGNDQDKNPDDIVANNQKEAVENKVYGNNRQFKLDHNNFGKKLSEQEFYDAYYPVVQQATKDTDVSAELVMKQLALSSDYGKNITTENGFSQAFSKRHGKNEKGSYLDINGQKLSTYKTFEDAVNGFVTALGNSNITGDNSDKQLNRLNKSGIVVNNTRNENYDKVNNIKSDKVIKQTNKNNLPDQWIEVGTDAAKNAIMEISGYEADDPRLNTMGVVFTTKNDNTNFQEGKSYYSSSAAYPGVMRNVLNMPEDYDIVEVNNQTYVIDNKNGEGLETVYKIDDVCVDCGDTNKRWLTSLGENKSAYTIGDDFGNLVPAEVFAKEATNYINDVGVENVTAKDWEIVNDYNAVIDQMFTEEAFDNWEGSDRRYIHQGGVDSKDLTEAIFDNLHNYRAKVYGPMIKRMMDDAIGRTQEKLNQLNGDLLQLEQNGGTADAINKLKTEIDQVEFNLSEQKEYQEKEIEALDLVSKRQEYTDPDYNPFADFGLWLDKQFGQRSVHDDYDIDENRKPIGPSNVERQEYLMNKQAEFVPWFIDTEDNEAAKLTTPEMITDENVDYVVDDGTTKSSYPSTDKPVVTQKKGTMDEILNLGENFETDPVTNITVKKVDDTTTIQDKLKNVREAIAKSYEQGEQVGEYAPDSQNADIGANILDAGRAILGMKGALADLPEYRTGDMYNLARDEMTARRDLGLSDEELAYARGMAERGYGYDVKNIRRLAGGSAGVALGNLGRAQRQLYNTYGQIAAQDQLARRANREQFYKGAVVDEGINRKMFEDDLTQAMMNKQAGAGLINDALGNIKDRQQFNRAYGKGSPYYELMKSEWISGEQERINAQEAQKQNQEKYRKQLKDQELDLLDQLEQRQTGDVDNPPEIINPNATNETTIVDDVQAGTGILNYASGVTGDVDISNAAGNAWEMAEMKRLMEKDNMSMADAMEAVNQSGNIDANTIILGKKNPASTDMDIAQMEKDFIDRYGKTPEEYLNKGTVQETINEGDKEDLVEKERKAGNIFDVSAVDAGYSPEDFPDDQDTKFNIYGITENNWNRMDDEDKQAIIEQGPAGSALVESIDEKVSPEEQTWEDKLNDYKSEFKDEETLKRYEEDPIAFVEEDIKSWEAQPDSEQKTQSLKNLRENLEILKNEEPGTSLVESVGGEMPEDWKPTADQVMEAVDAGIIGTGISGTEATKEDNKKIYDWLNNKEGATNTEEQVLLEKFKKYDDQRVWGETGKKDNVPIDLDLWSKIDDYNSFENTAISKKSREKIDAAIYNNVDFSYLQSLMEDEMGKVGDDGKMQATPHTPAEIDTYDSDGFIENTQPMRGGYGKKQGIKMLFPELKDNEELFNSPQSEMLRMWNVNKGFNPKVLAALSQGLIEKEDRGAYHNGKKDINTVEGIDISKIDPQVLLNELTDAYKNTYGKNESSTSGNLPKNYDAYAERIITLAKRHGLQVPKNLWVK